MRILDSCCGCEKPGSTANDRIPRLQYQTHFLCFRVGDGSSWFSSKLEISIDPQEPPPERMEPSWLTFFPATTGNYFEAASIRLARRVSAARGPSPNEGLYMASWGLRALRLGNAHCADIESSAILVTASAARIVWAM